MLTRRAVLAGSMVLGGSSRWWGDSVDIRAYGAAGNGRDDDTASIQAAVNDIHAGGGGTVSIPAARSGGYWRVTAPILLKSRVRLLGSGPASVLFNDRAVSHQYMDQAVILIGNYHPEFLNKVRYDRVILDDARHNRLMSLNADARVRYSRGMSVMVRTLDATSADVLTSIPDRTWICRIETVEKSHVVVSRNIESTLELGIAPCDGEVKWRNVIPNTECFVSVKSSIENMSIRSHGFWTGDSGAYKCHFTKLWIDSAVGIYGNLFQSCVWDDVQCKFRRQAVELSCNSERVHINRMVALQSGDEEENHQIIAMQENSRDCRMSNFVIRANQFAKYGSVIRFGPSEGCSIENGEVFCCQAKGTLVSFDTAKGKVRGNTVSRVVLHGRDARVGIAFSPGDGGIVSGNRIDDVTVEGMDMAIAARIGGEENSVSNSRLGKGRIEVLRSAKKCMVLGKTIDAPK